MKDLFVCPSCSLPYMGRPGLHECPRAYRRPARGERQGFTRAEKERIEQLQAEWSGRADR